MILPFDIGLRGNMLDAMNLYRFASSQSSTFPYHNHRSRTFKKKRRKELKRRNK